MANYNITYWDRFLSSSSNSTFLQNIKLSKKTLHRHKFYINLVDFFAPLFKIDDLSLIKLSGASYLYFNTLISFDKLIDKDEGYNISYEFIFHFQEAVRILESLFPSEIFWKQLYSHFQQLYVINTEEKKLSQESASENILEEIAKGKSIMVYSIIDALTILSQNNKYTEQLKKILDLIHLAFQIRDDINDFKQDISKNQLTLPIYKINSFIKEKNIEVKSTKELYNLLYGSGIASQLIGKSISLYLEAQTISKTLQLDQLSQFLETEIKDCNNQLYEIELIKIKSLQSNKKSNVNLFAEPQNQKDIIEKSLKTTYLFFENNINNNGWADFITSAGISLGWAQYFIASNLIDAGEIQLVKDYFSKNNELIDSYNDNIIPDCDTLSFKVDTLLGLKFNIDNNLISKWKEYSNNGIWTTYKPDKKFLKYLNLSNVEQIAGWTSYHKCVSSFSAYVLSKHKLDIELLQKTLQKIFQGHNDGMLIEAYWWTSPIYSTYYTLLSIINTNYKIDFKDKIDPIVQNLISFQNSEGCWTDEFNQNSSFYTAMLIDLLIKYNSNKYSKQIENGIQYLLKNQMSDGSWKTIYKLKIPSPEIIYPSQVNNWRKGSLGINTIVDDHNRFLTTSLIYKAIKSYYNNIVWD